MDFVLDLVVAEEAKLRIEVQNVEDLGLDAFRSVNELELIGYFTTEECLI